MDNVYKATVEVTIFVAAADRKEAVTKLLGYGGLMDSVKKEAQNPRIVKIEE